MLPDLRAIIAALVTSVGLLLIGYGVVVSLRTAQDRTVSPLQETRDRLRTNPFAATPAPPAETSPSSAEAPQQDDRSVAAAPASSPEAPRAEAETTAETPVSTDRSAAAAPEANPAAAPGDADAPTPSEPAVAADQPPDRFVIESLVCPPATAAPRPSVASAAGSDATEPAAPPAIAGVPIPRERPPMGGPAPDEPGITGSLSPNRPAAAPSRSAQKQGAKRLAARVAPRPRPVRRARPAPQPRQKGLLETLFGR